MKLNDATRAAIIALAQSTFPMLVAAGIIHPLDQQTTGIFMLFITNLVTLAALAFKSGQGVGPDAVPLADHVAAVDAALQTPPPLHARDVEDVIDAYVAKMKAAGVTL